MKGKKRKYSNKIKQLLQSKGLDFQYSDSLADGENLIEEPK
jgi:hypothetical protein